MSDDAQSAEQERLQQLNEVAAPAPVPASKATKDGGKATESFRTGSMLPIRKALGASSNFGSSRKKTTGGKAPKSSSTTSTSTSSGQRPPRPVEAADSTSEPQVGRPVTDDQHPIGNADGEDSENRDVSPSLEEKHEGTHQRGPFVLRALRKPKGTTTTTISDFSTLATRIYTLGYLVLFSILGALARLGLQALTFYPGAPVQQGLVWANFSGSFVMGFLAEDRQLFRHEWGGRPLSEMKPGVAASAEGDAQSAADKAAEGKRHGAVKKTIPLFIGLATGFCGSFTSFSSFQRDVFLALANDSPSPELDGRHALARGGGYSFLAVLASLIITPALSLAALQVGAHLALASERWIPSLNFYFVRGFLDPVATFIGFGAWLGAVFMAIWPPDRPHGPAAYYHETWAHETWRGQAIFACVFAPLGTLVRFYVSLLLNPRIASFPLGTFTVNMFGTLMESVFYDLQHAKIPSAGGHVGAGRIGCQVLQGLQDGFCGCVTTVSTWVAELKGLRRSHSYVYGVVSLAVGLGLTVIIMGSLRWTHGFYAPQCVTSRTW